MTTISPSKIFSNKLRAALLLSNYSIKEYAAKYSFDLFAVYSVVSGRSGKLRSPVTEVGRIVEQLKRDGLWPAEEDQPQ